MSDTVAVVAIAKTPSEIAAEYFGKFHLQCEGVLKHSLAEPNLTKIAASHRFAPELALWCEMIGDNREVELFRVAGHEYEYSLLALTQGHYRHAFQMLTTMGKRLSIKRFTEYGANYPVFGALTTVVGEFQEVDISAVLQRELGKSIDVLDLTEYQKNGLHSISIDTVGAGLQASEEEFQRISYVGPKRSRRMMNVVVASVLEYLSG